MKRAILLAVGALGLAACQDMQAPLSTSGPGEASLSQGAPSGVIPGRFIVTLRSDAQPEAVAQSHDVQPAFVYRHALNGFAGSMSEAARSGLLQDARVVRVEPDRVVTTMAGGSQSNATWGLDRIDQRSLPLNSTYTYETTATNVHAYIIDTGIRFGHQDFGGRVQGACFDAFGGNCNDGNGHGTHVAGTVGGSVYGVAKGVRLYAVRVLDNNGSGSIGGVVAGVDWVTARKQTNPTHPMVANMSLGGGASAALDDAVRNSIAAGVTYAVAAGNGDFLGRQQPACNYSPARVREALTVGATTSSDAKTSWSNYGECVDIFAPGASITSAWHTSNTSTNTISGTSMAAPHVAGAAALFLAGNPSATPAQVFQAVSNNSTKTIVTNSSTTNNHLLYSIFGSGGGDPTPPPAPTSLSATTQSTSRIDLAWSHAGGADNFQIERCQGASCASFSLIQTVDGSARSFSNTGLTSNTTYGYRVRAVSTAGTSGYSNTVYATTSGSTPPSQFTLTGTGSKVQGRWRADLSWTGSSASQIDVFRQGSKIATVSNDGGSYVDQTNNRGSGSLTYRVCEAGTSTCSNDVTIQF